MDTHHGGTKGRNDVFIWLILAYRCILPSTILLHGRESREFVRSINIRGGEVPGEVGIND
jgi:hypothetical protein